MKKKILFLVGILSLFTLLFFCLGLLSFGGLGLTLAMAIPVVPVKDPPKTPSEQSTSVMGSIKEQIDGAESGVSDIIDIADQRELVKEESDYALISSFMKNNKRISTTQLIYSFATIDERPYAVDLKTNTTATHKKVTQIKVTEDQYNICVNNEVLAFVSDVTPVPSYDAKGNKRLWKPLTARIIEKKEEGGEYLFKLQAINGKLVNNTPTFEDNIPVGTKMVRMGSAMAEWQLQNDPYSTLPTTTFNTCQKSGFQVSTSRWFSNHKKNYGFDEKVIFGYGLKDFYTRTEIRHLLGGGQANLQFMGDVISNEYIPVSNGILNYLDKRFDFAGSIDANNPSAEDKKLAKIFDMVHFAYDGSGNSGARVMLVSSNVQKTLEQITYVQRQMNSTSVEEIMGVKLNHIVLGGHDIMIKWYPILDMCGLDNHFLILDPRNIKEVYFDNMFQKTIDLSQNMGADGKATFFIETTCAIITNRNSHLIGRL